MQLRSLRSPRTCLHRISRTLAHASGVACILICTLACAEATRDLRHEVLSTWTTDQGLPQNFVTAIQQTPDGFLWVGTTGGLARFDGLRFRTFVSDGPPALRHRISALAVDGSGALWIGTTAGLFTYKGGVFHAMPAVADAATPVVETLRSPRDGSIWVRTSKAIFHANGDHVAMLTLPINPEQVSDFAEDRQGRLWFAQGDTIAQTDLRKVVATFRLPSVNLLYTSADGEVFAGDGHHLFRFTSGSFALQPKQGTDEFVHMLIDSQHRVWMASGGLQGISRFADGKLQMFDARDGLESNDARVLFEDRTGDMWIGTISGLQRLHRGTFISYDERDGLPAGHNQYDAIFEDRAGTLWAGTLESGIVRMDGDHWRSYGVAEGLRRGQVRGFADGDADPVIAVSDYGLFASQNGSYHKLPGVPAGYIASPVRGSDGALWFSVLHKSVYRLQHGVLKAYGAAEGLPDNGAWALLPDRDGIVWAGTKSGLFRWDGTRWHEVYASTSPVIAIALSHDGSIFLGTSNGLVRTNGSRSWSLTQEEGLPGDAVFSLTEDNRGDLWVATARGICRISLEQLQALNRGTSGRIIPELFTEDDGLRSRSVLPIGQVTTLRARDGRIWFATATGPAVGDPLTMSPAPPHAVVDAIGVDEQHFPAMPLVVKPGHHRLVFTFTAPMFLAPEQVRFRYRLLGWDNDWTNADSVREASYMGLPPGEYTFEVQAQSRTGEFGPISAGASVRLRPFVWQTRPFLFVVVLTLAACVAEVTRRRTLLKAEALNLRFQERASERERIASHIHDTFIQDLTGTALQLELVGLQLDEDPVVAQHSLSNLAARMREMIARSRDIVSNLHSMAGSQYTLLEMLSHIQAEFRLGEAPVFVLHSEGVPQMLHPLLRDEIHSICREAVANAFRHAGAETIEVKVIFSQAKLVVEIRDDGVGMSEELRTKGRAGHFGISGMHAHARRIDASLRVESAPGAGTRVLLERSLRHARSPWTKRWLRRGHREAGEDHEEILEHHT